MSKGYGVCTDSQIKTTQKALDAALIRNGHGLADSVDIEAMASSVGAGSTPLASAVSETNPYVGPNDLKPGGRP
jgi:hypothetical protein